MFTIDRRREEAFNLQFCAYVLLIHNTYYDLLLSAMSHDCRHQDPTHHVIHGDNGATR